MSYLSSDLSQRRNWLSTAPSPESDAPDPVGGVDLPYHNPPDAGPRGIEQMQLPRHRYFPLRYLFGLIATSQISNWTSPVQDPTKSLRSAIDTSDSGLLLKRRLSEYDTNDHVLYPAATALLTLSLLLHGLRAQLHVEPRQISSLPLPIVTSPFSHFDFFLIFCSHPASDQEICRPNAPYLSETSALQLRELIAKCHRACRRNTSVSKLQVLESEEQTRMTSISVSILRSRPCQSKTSLPDR
ncbi:hypothetical protein BS47DRAFT_1391961 [Hydnum rufescens UP504]|uniref:Uncharacterized protein n=1 Tax=Hydnum rufescens UP504 TaxID=1448309 RepID=A0A9P6B121_9AGAM|nr:hypothetical protein BS47DRAFT_1391961 [Hydnum rufescens UP504]